MIKQNLRIIIIIIAIFGNYVTLNSQNLCADGMITTDEINFMYQVKQIDEFMKRFNHEQLVVSPEKDSLWKERNLVLLFDKQTYLSNRQLADSMINVVVDDSLKIHFYDTTWCALATCQVKFKKKIDTIQLVLQTEYIKDYMYKWVIKNAFGDLLNLNPNPKSEQLSISPVDNEINFMSLSSICKYNAQNIIRYNDKDYKVNTLDVFNALVYTGQLSIEHVIDMEYHFSNIKDYSFVVNYYNRDEPNSGWLISSVKKMIKDNLINYEQK